MLAKAKSAAASLLLLVGIILATGHRPVAAETVVICPALFGEAIKPYLVYRSSQGHKLLLIENLGTAAEIRAQIVKLSEQKHLDAILIVGDTGSPKPQTTKLETGTVPTHYLPARIITPFGGDRMIASDNPYGDLDGDQIAEIPVGRLPADTPEELRRMIDRIVDYESNTDYSLWRSRINLIAGLGDFGGLIDAVIENTTKMFLISGIPAEYRTSMTRASWKSPYCPDPRQFRNTAIARMNEGCLFWIYLGHGHLHTLDRLHVPGGEYSIFSTADAGRLECNSGTPIALLFCCYAAAFDAPEDCLAEEMLRSNGGPVAVLGGSRTTMPYAMGAFGDALMDECFRKRTGTIGEIFTHAKKRLAAEKPDGGNRPLIDSLGRLFSGSEADLRAQRFEHLHLFNLLGDPLTQIQAPRDVPISAPRIVEEAAEVAIELDAPIAGQATIELIVRRGTLRTEPPPRVRYEPQEETLLEFQQHYLDANNQQLDVIRTPVLKGRLEIHLKLPPGITGPCHARVYIQGEHDFAMGATDIYVDRRPDPPSDDIAKAKPKKE